MKNHLLTVVSLCGLVLALSSDAATAADSWPRRFFDAQNTANVGPDPKLTAANAPDLKVVATLAATGPATFGVTVPIGEPAALIFCCV